MDTSANQLRRLSSRQTDDNLLVNQRTAELSDSYLKILQSIGEDPEREGLKKTPERAAKAILYFTKGYEENISGKQISLIFEEVKNTLFFCLSRCQGCHIQ